MRISTFWTLKSQVWLKPFPALLVWTVLSGSFSGVFSTILAENAKVEELLNAGPLKEPSGIWSYPPDMPEAKVEIYKKVGDVELKASVL